MRPLNRPMFRNGGPIKEGIMSGMQDRPGYSLAGRVGGFFQNVFKKKPVQTGTVVANKKGSVVGEGFKKIKELFTGTPTTTVKSVDNLKTKPSLSQSKIPGAEGSVSPVSFNTQTTYNTLPVGMSLSNKNLYAAAQNVLTPTTKLVAGTAKALKPYSGVITIGGIGAYSLFNDDGTPKSTEQIKTETGASETEIASAINEANKGGGEGVKRDAEIEANRKRYYKLMGIDKMNKDAVYNSLIDASNQIREGGNIKDQLKSGDLVGGVINALSKNLDKSVDLKKQIDAAILKGEITKDINREKDQLDAEYKRMAITKTKSDMAGGTLNQIINDRKSKGMVTSGQDLFKLAVQTGNASNIKEIISDKAVSNYFKDNPTSTAADFFQEKVIAPAIEKGQSITPGDYIVGENILRVSADGSIQFVF
jgi:biotin operon repressor